MDRKEDQTTFGLPEAAGRNEQQTPKKGEWEPGLQPKLNTTGSLDPYNIPVRYELLFSHFPDKKMQSQEPEVTYLRSCSQGNHEYLNPDLFSQHQAVSKLLPHPPRAVLGGIKIQLPRPQSP